MSPPSSFTFKDQDILCISVSLNACYVLQLVTSRLVKWLLPLLAPRGSMWKTLLGLHQKWPDLLGRLLMEQISLFTILVLILINLGCVSAIVSPFRQHNQQDYHQLTRVILGASTARFIAIALGIIFPNTISLCIVASGSNTRRSGVDLIYYTFSIASNIIGLGYRQNLLLLVTSSFMELNTTPFIICRLIKLADRHRCCRSYIKSSILCFAAFLFSRVLLPILFLCHAIGQESPYVMDTVPLVWFFVSGGVYLIFHVIFMYLSVKRIVKASGFLSDGEKCNHTNCPEHEPFSVCNFSQRLTNEIVNELDYVDIEKVQWDNGVFHSSSRTNTTFRDLNYGFLAPYDNRNLCSFVTELEEEKMNFLQKKIGSKNEFMCKFISKGTSTRQCTTCRNVHYHCKDDETET